MVVAASPHCVGRHLNLNSVSQRRPTICRWAEGGNTAFPACAPRGFVTRCTNPSRQNVRCAHRRRVTCSEPFVREVEIKFPSTGLAGDTPASTGRENGREAHRNAGG